MSQKIDSTGTAVGPYGIDDLETYMFPNLKRKGKRREKFRRLHYDLVWDITEMQVKVHVRALFPNQIGPLTTQLAKQRQLGAHEKTLTGESRSKALGRDIEITAAALLDVIADAADTLDSEMRREVMTDAPESAGLQQSDDLAGVYEQLVRTEPPQITSPTGGRLQLRVRSMNDSVPVSLIPRFSSELHLTV